MENIEKVTGKSVNLIDDNKKKIGELFPEVITESIDSNGELVHAIDFEKLKQLLSDSLIDHNERYEFTWVGKNKAILEAGTPISKTLRPQKEKSVDWDHTENIYIEGDNLEALKLLQESYLNKIDVIYIDPPYNTGKDHIYDDDFKLSREEYEEMTNEFDEYNRRIISSKKDSARFHSNWLSMMYPRLKLARNLLSDDGVIFISIDDNEQAHLKELCDEIFGEENFISNISWANKEGGGSSDSKTFRNKAESIICYSKNFNNVEIKGEDISNTKRYNLSDIHEKERGKFYLQKLGMGSIRYSESMDYPIEAPDGSLIYPKDNNNGRKAIWRWSKEKLNWGLKNDFIVIKKNKEGIWTVYTKQYMKVDNEGNKIIRTQQPINFIDKYSSTQATKELKLLDMGNLFNYPKPSQLLIWILKRIYNSSIILDFFSGSGTTADAVMQLNAEDGGNRKFIMVQLPKEIEDDKEAYKEGYRYITEIGEERIRRAGAKIKEEHPEVDTGFRVFKIDSSNIKEVAKTPSQVTQIELLEDERNIKEDRNDLDLLYQVMIDWGLELSLPYELEQINGVSVHNVFDGALIACFADKLSESLIRSIAEKHPFRVVFKDSSFKNSAMKANVVQIFKEISPETKIKVL